jgi:hypothetical protein
MQSRLYDNIRRTQVLRLEGVSLGLGSSSVVDVAADNTSSTRAVGSYC